MITFDDPTLYAKGTCNVVVSDPATGDVVYQSSKVQTASINTSVDAGAVRAGLGNAIAIQIASDANVELSMTNAEFDLYAKGMQIGSEPTYAAPVPVCESITATSSTLLISQDAVAPLGYKSAIAYVTKPDDVNHTGIAGRALYVNENMEVEGFTAQIGETYLVYYWVQQVNARQLTVYSHFAPAVRHVTIQIAVYSMQSIGKWRGHRIGWLYYIIPRMQFSGSTSLSGDQTAADTTAITGTALTYEQAAEIGTCTDCELSHLAYMVYVPNASPTETVSGLLLIGGAMSVKNNSSAQITVKYLMSDGTLETPDYSALTFETSGTVPDGTSVSNTGIITTGDVEGSFTITVYVTDDETLSVTIPVTVYIQGRDLVINSYSIEHDYDIVVNGAYVIAPLAAMRINGYSIPAIE